MGRVIKLFIYFFAYQFLAGAIMIGGYMIANQTTDIPSAEQFMHDHLIWMQLLYALLLTAHLLGWKYASYGKSLAYFCRIYNRNGMLDKLSDRTDRIARSLC